jgi:hypothetical protein
MGDESDGTGGSDAFDPPTADERRSRSRRLWWALAAAGLVGVLVTVGLVVRDSDGPAVVATSDGASGGVTGGPDLTQPGVADCVEGMAGAGGPVDTSAPGGDPSVPVAPTSDVDAPSAEPDRTGAPDDPAAGGEEPVASPPQDPASDPCAGPETDGSPDGSVPGSPDGSVPGSPDGSVPGSQDGSVPGSSDGAVPGEDGGPSPDDMPQSPVPPTSGADAGPLDEPLTDEQVEGLCRQELATVRAAAARHRSTTGASATSIAELVQRGVLASTDLLGAYVFAPSGDPHQVDCPLF